MVVVLATMSSIMSGFGFVGGPGLVFESGSTSFWITFAATFAMPLGAVMLGKRLRLLAEVREILTLPDAVEARYGGRWPRAAMAVAILLGVLGYLGTQVMAIGVVLMAVLGVDLRVGLAIGLGVLAFYSIAGGIMAGVYTDLFQGLLMIGASLAVFSFAVNAAGGLNAIGTTLWEMDPAFLGPWGSRGPLTSLSWFLLFVIGGVGQPHGITKFMMLKDIGNLKWAGLLTGPCYALLSLLWVSIGLSMRTLVENGVHSPLASPDHAAPVFLLNYVPELLAGVVFAGLLAAIMSTADSFLNLGAASVVRDIPTALLGRPLERELLWSRVATGVVACLIGAFCPLHGEPDRAARHIRLGHVCRRDLPKYRDRAQLEASDWSGVRRLDRDQRCPELRAGVIGAARTVPASLRNECGGVFAPGVVGYVHWGLVVAHSRRSTGSPC